MQILMALFTVLAPSLVELLPIRVSVYALFLLFAAILTVRISKTGKIHFSVFHIILIVLLTYLVLSSFWANNREGHLRYIVCISTLLFTFSVATDYFAESTEEKIHRRMLYMIAMSAFLCALTNIIYWLMYLVPFAKKQSFSQGMGTSDFLAIFMLVGIGAVVYLIVGNSKLRKRILIPSALLMFFVFLMAKSVAAWILAIIVALIFVIGKKSEKVFFIASALGASLFFVILIWLYKGSLSGQLIKDVLSYAINNPFGYGGGFESAIAFFATQPYGKNLMICPLVYLFAASGLIGVLCALAVFARNIIVFSKLRTWESLFGVFATTIIFLLPFKYNFAVMFLWLGITAYNERSAGLVFKGSFKKETLSKTVFLLGVVMVISSIMLCHALICITADGKFKRGDYKEAYSLYTSAASINITDSESCTKAAMSLRKAGKIKENRELALLLCDKAIKRNLENSNNFIEKARIYFECEEYDLALQQYAILSEKALVNDKYNLEMAKCYFKIVQRNPKGSSETKRAYEKIQIIAANTADLDYRKEINDIADKALVYTKGEILGGK